jgi:hypothetical protein
MRVVIACPPLSDFYTTPHRLAALGAEALRRSLEADGHEARVFNFPLESGGRDHTAHSRVLPLPPELAYLRPFIMENETGPAAFFTHYQRWGGADDDCARLIAADNPDIVCLSSFAYGYAGETVRLGRALKNINPGLFIIAGGAGPTANPLAYLNDSGIDAVLTGEGEATLPRFLHRFEGRRNSEGESIPGLYEAGADIGKPAIAAGPVALPDCVIAEGGRIGRRRYFSVSLARGCPKSCAFCSNHLVHGRALRKAPVESIALALRTLRDRLESEPGNSGAVCVIHFNFEDDNLLIDPGYFYAALDLFSNAFPGATFSAENGLDFTLLTVERLNHFAMVGFTQFNLSLVSAVPEILRDARRTDDLPQFRSVVKEIALLKLPAIAYFIAGFKTDTKASTARTLALLAGLPVRIGFSPFYAVPGMELAAGPDRFFQKAPRLSLGSSLYPWTGSLSTETLATIFRLARFVNLIKSNKASEHGALIERFLKGKSFPTYVRSKGKLQIVPVSRYDGEMVELFLHHWQTRPI